MTRSSLTHDDVTQILRLIDELPDVDMRMEKDDFSLHVRKGVAAALPQSGPQADAGPQRKSDAVETSVVARPGPVGKIPPTADARRLDVGLVGVRAPMLGRFYRASSPNEPPFVEVGSLVGEEDTVCMIEVMKLFNTVKAGVSGTIEAIHVENNAMVEFDQLLIAIRPN